MIRNKTVEQLESEGFIVSVHYHSPERRANLPVATASITNTTLVTDQETPVDEHVPEPDTAEQIAAEKKAERKAKALALKKAKAEAADKVNANKEEVSRNDPKEMQIAVRKQLGRISKLHDKAYALQALADFGNPNLSDIPDERLPLLLDHLTAVE